MILNQTAFWQIMLLFSLVLFWWSLDLEMTPESSIIENATYFCLRFQFPVMTILSPKFVGNIDRHGHYLGKKTASRKRNQ